MFLDGLAGLEQTALSLWVRESPSLLAFPFILFLHTLGLAMLAGLSVGIDAWLLSTRAVIPARLLSGVQKIMWLGFGINAVSGMTLLVAYPAKALTNWVFFVKLLFVALAMWVVEVINREMSASSASGSLAGSRVRRLAVASLALWAGAIVTGRFLAYTHSVLLASEGF